MSDITEGLGTAVEGGLLAGAVEQKGGAAEGGAETGECLNCGTPLVGSHCHVCGQKGDVHRSLGAIGHEIMHGVLHLDGKIWRTLPLLLLKPGQLTRRYIEGERAKFVGPMAMFLFSVFIMFAVFQAAGLSAPTDLQPGEQTVATLEQAGETAKTQTAQQRENLEQQIAALPARDPERAKLEEELEGLEAADEFISKASGSGGLLRLGDPDSEWNITSVAAIDDGLIKKWRENPGLMVYKLQTNAYKFSWLLIPLSIPFVWSLFFWKRRFKAYDHAVFVTYSIAFMSLLFIVLSLGGMIGIPSGILTAIALVVPPLHIYKDLRGSYSLSRFGALGRTGILLAMISLLVAPMFLIILLLLGAF